MGIKETVFSYYAVGLSSAIVVFVAYALREGYVQQLFAEAIFSIFIFILVGYIYYNHM